MTQVIQTQYDRKATPLELEVARKAISKKNGGIGIVQAARLLGWKSPGNLSLALQGLYSTPLKLSDLRKLRGEVAA